MLDIPLDVFEDPDRAGLAPGEHRWIARSGSFIGEAATEAGALRNLVGALVLDRARDAAGDCIRRVLERSQAPSAAQRKLAAEAQARAIGKKPIGTRSEPHEIGTEVSDHLESILRDPGP